MNRIPVLNVLMLAGALAFGASASAQINYEPAASAVTDRSYTVSYEPDCGPMPPGYYCVQTTLEERVGEQGSWIGISSGIGSASFSDRAPGLYFYRVHVAAYDPQYDLIDAYSPVISVTVDLLAERAHILEQLEYEYRVREGDIDGDGKLDFFVDRTAGGEPLDGTIDKVLLRQQSGPGFAAVVPTVAQLASVAGWSLSEAEAFVEDFNADGFVDVALTGVADVIAGASDQFIFAPAQIGLSTPQGVRSFDREMIRFVSDAMDYLHDENFFSDFAPAYFFETSYWHAYCEVYGTYDPWHHPLDYGLLNYWSMQDYWSPQMCYVDYYYQAGVYQDYSGFSNEALRLWRNEYLAASGYMDEQAAVDEVEAGIERLIGVRIGGWPMEELLGPVGTHRDPFVRAGIEIGRTVLGQARAGRNRTTSRLVPPQHERVPDQIYITGHPLLFAPSRGHLALEYTGWHGVTGLPAPYETISAGPEEDSLINNGKLIGETNRPTDHPLFNHFIAEVEPQLVSNFVYWETYLKQRHENYDALPHDQKVDYAFVPLSWSDTYNSNSYISGITHDSPVNVQINPPSGLGARYPGWNKPVPDNLFQ